MRKRRAFHIAVTGFFLFQAGACERGNPGLNDSDTVIAGYRIEGKLIDDFQRPLTGVEVFLYYDLALLSGDSTSRAYIPTVQSEVVTVDVKDTTGQVIRLVFSGPAPQDSAVYFFWDGRNDSGDVVRSGIYLISYTVASVVKKSYRMIVDGNLNCVTDTGGRFVIPGTDLPVDDIAPYYDSSDSFVGQFQITSDVFLRFITPTFDRSFRVSLVKNKITKISVVLN